MTSTTSHLPASDQRLDVYKKAQSNDPTCKQMKYCQEGWPNKSQLDLHLKPYWEAQSELTEGDGLYTNVRPPNCGPKVTPKRDTPEGAKRSPRPN